MKRRYEWEDESLTPIDIGSMLCERDPRDYPVGYFAGSTFVLADVSNFIWFKDEEEVASFLRKGEPLMWGPGIVPALERVCGARDFCVNEPFRKAINACQGEFMIHWWGRYSDLLSGDMEFARGLRAGFQEIEGRAPADAQDEFVEFLETYGC